MLSGKRGKGVVIYRSRRRGGTYGLYYYTVPFQEINAVYENDLRNLSKCYISLALFVELTCHSDEVASAGSQPSYPTLIRAIIARLYIVIRSIIRIEIL